MSHFFDYSKYYNLLYKDKNYQEEVDYIDSLIKKYNAKAVQLLDVGCGTGNHAKLMARKGYNIHGIDLSEQMLEIAKSGQSDITFEQGDIRHFKLDRRFDVITSLFHVMSYQTSNEDVVSSFKAVHNHLNKDGLFIFDFWYGPAVMMDPPSVRVKKMENESLKVIRVAEPLIDYDQCIVSVQFDVNIFEKQLSQLDSLQETHPMRYFFKNELHYFASQGGFEVLNFYAWLSMNEPSKDKWYAVAVCKIRG